jgi:hypothetical protein
MGFFNSMVNQMGREAGRDLYRSKGGGGGGCLSFIFTIIGLFVIIFIGIILGNIMFSKNLVGVSSVNSLHIRQDTTITSPIIGGFNLNDTIKIDELYHNGWYKIKFNDSINGYIRKEFVIPVSYK